MNPTTTTQSMREGEELFNIDLENFPMSIIEIMLFKLEDNGEIAAQKLLKIVLEFARMKKNKLRNSRYFLISQIDEGDDMDFW